MAIEEMLDKIISILLRIEEKMDTGSVWSLEEYEPKYEAPGGTLLLSFRPTHLASMQAEEGELQLWSEVRSYLKNPRSPERKEGIQPDYTLYKQASDAGKCLAAVEVKQYRRPSTRKFQDAINDYADGLPKAAILLVNYGTMSEKIIPEHPEHSHFLGMVRPGTEDSKDFVELLRSVLPAPPIPFPPGLQPTINTNSGFLIKERAV
jgi:hypothetical protein